MTKRKAIEAAVVEALNSVPAKLWGFSYFNSAIAERAYEYGRIAGMRKIVNLLPHAGMMRARDTRRKFRSYANALAKKARAK